MSDPIYVQTEDAAARLNLAPSTLNKMRVRGDGPPFLRLSPRRVVYAIASLDAWARAREHTSTSEYATA
jgi:hypothetical protein